MHSNCQSDPRIFPKRLCHKPLGITECCALPSRCASAASKNPMMVGAVQPLPPMHRSTGSILCRLFQEPPPQARVRSQAILIGLYQEQEHIPGPLSSSRTARGRAAPPTSSRARTRRGALRPTPRCRWRWRTQSRIVRRRVPRRPPRGRRRIPLHLIAAQMPP